ncbi:MAG: oligoendopeptidase F [Holophaga sp.]|jgi:oligoendopeptidase F
MRLLAPALTFALAAAPLPAPGQGVPDYANTPRSQVPEASKARFQDIYASPEIWRKELEAVRTTLPRLDVLAKGWTDTPQAMAGLLEWRDRMAMRVERLGVYASLQSDMDLGDSQFQAMKGEAQDLLTTFNARLAFVDPDVLALGEARVKACLDAEPRLAPYRVELLRTLRLKDHVLPAGEERVAALADAFTDAPAKASSILNDLDLPRPTVTLSTGEQVTLNTATFGRVRRSPSAADRRLAATAYWASQAAFGNTQAALLDANVKTHVFEAKVHRYDSCLEAALFPNAIAPEVYANLVDTLRANLAPLHRLLRLRRRMLGLKDMTYADVYASAVPSVERTFTYAEAEDLVRRATAPLGPEYAAALDTALTHRWVDIYPNRGKQSGAYCTDQAFGFHPFVKLNYDGSYNAVATLAHELGHAMHTVFSDRAQPYATSAYPTFLAEVASTFNENLLVHHLLGTGAPHAFKLFVLDGYLEELRGTLYRQGLFAEFERAMHAQGEQGQSLAPEWLDRTYLDLTRLYYGHGQGVIRVEDWIKSEWSAIPHFYMDFYVFQYATSMAASMALAKAVLEQGEPARERYLDLLRSGGSKFPLDALRDAGVDFTTPKPVEEALKEFDRLVGEMEKLYDRIGHPA